MKEMRKKRLFGSFYDRKTEKGFTLVEIVAVVFFLGLLLVPVMATLVRALMVSNEVEYLTVATFLAVEKIEETRARVSCYSTVVNNCPGDVAPIKHHVFDQAFNETCTFPSPYAKYKCTVEYVKTNPPWSNNRLYEIQVRVWYDKNNDNSWDAIEPDVFLETKIYSREPIVPNV